MATMNRSTFEALIAAPEFKRVQGTRDVVSVFRRADVKAVMQEVFTNLQGVAADGRPKYEKFLRTIEKTYANELAFKIRSYGP